MRDGVQLAVAVVAGRDERELPCVVLAAAYLLGSRGHWDWGMKSLVRRSVVLLLENIESLGTGSI